MGAKSTFTQEMADEICARMREGESLRTICKTPGYPAASTVCLWVEQHPDFAEQYARARDALIDVYAQEVVEIADESPTLIFKELDGVEVAMVDHAAVAYQRHRTDSRKWYASKCLPKKYGDKQEVEHSGNITFQRTVYAELDYTPALPVQTEALPAPSTKGSGRWD